MLLAGDVGGTKTRLALFDNVGSQLKRGRTEQFKSADYPNLETIIAHFLSNEAVKPLIGCVGVPGPVVDGRVKITNLPWQLAENEIEKHTGLKKLRLVNDLYATTAAIPHLGASELHTLYPAEGATSRIVKAVIAPGTGLGQGFLYEGTTGNHTVLSSEGGHATFAPDNERELELSRFLMNTYDRVSVEHVLCGPGLTNIYSFLKQSVEEPTELSQELESAKDRAAIIAKHGLSKKYQICVETLDIFCNALGSHAGNMALSLLATGGVYLGGGIPPKIIEKLNDGTLVQAFLRKGKLAQVVRATPVYVIKDDFAALTGAAHLASLISQ